MNRSCMVTLIAHVPHGQTWFDPGGPLVCSTATSSEGGQTRRDTLRRYRAIHHALTQWYPTDPPRTCARHLHPLMALITQRLGHVRRDDGLLRLRTDRSRGCRGRL